MNVTYLYGVLGAVYIVWGALQLFFSINNFFIQKTVTSVDALGLITGSTFTLSYVFGVATLVEGLLLALFAWQWEWVAEEMKQKRNWVRWIRWGIADALFLAGLGFLAGIPQIWLIIAFSMIAVAINFAQAANETENAYGFSYTSSSSKLFEFRYDGWLVALLLVAFLAVFFDWNMANKGVTLGALAAVISWQALYVILHLLIVFWLTNTSGGPSEYREVVFEVARLLIIGTITGFAYWY